MKRKYKYSRKKVFELLDKNLKLNYDVMTVTWLEGMLLATVSECTEDCLVDCPTHKPEKKYELSLVEERVRKQANKSWQNKPEKFEIPTPPQLPTIEKLSIDMDDKNKVVMFKIGVKVGELIDRLNILSKRV